MVEIAALAMELAGETAPAEKAVSPDEPAAGGEPAAAGAGASLFGVLDAEQRIRAIAEQNEGTLWASAVFVTLLYVSLVVLHVMGLGGLSGLERDLERQRQERRGQDATSISVELVPDPDKNAKTTKWRDDAQQGPTPNPAPPQPQQQPMQAQPDVPQEQQEEQPTEEQAKEEPKEKEEPDEKEKKEAGQPSLPDLEALVDAAADDLNAKVKAHYDRKPSRPRPQQQAMYSGGGMQVRGSGASGKSDEFSKSVIAALMKTRPGPFALWGRVLVSFQITQQGDLLYVRVLHSSGNKALDDAAVNAIHKAQFVKPPPGLPPEARTYIIDYIFG
jgi:protein TonB